jgi:HEPN domain-containing protein
MGADVETAARTWLAWALGDLEAARRRPGRPQRPRIAAFHAQQAVAKALKGALVLAGVVVPRTHDLDDLRNRLPDGWRAKASHRNLASLSVHGVESRYPDDLTPVTPIQAVIAVRQAMAVVRTVREDFDRRGVSTVSLEPQ